ncbi:MAG TPA: hypothetical protein VGJ95_17900 [Pseudonocardiaceae bacterium]
MTEGSVVVCDGVDVDGVEVRGVVRWWWGLVCLVGPAGCLIANDGTATCCPASSDVEM